MSQPWLNANLSVDDESVMGFCMVENEDRSTITRYHQLLGTVWDLSKVCERRLASDR